MLLFLAACHSDPEGSVDPSDPSGTSPTELPVETGSEPWNDPFAAQPDTDEGLTNVSDDLEAILEHGELLGACDRWHASPDDRRLELLCGKSMFFYEGFETLGIPAVLFDLLPELFPDEVGPAYANVGLVPHPTDPGGRPIGFGYGAKLGDNDTFALTCAACHFGPVGDGRYAVGSPNLGYDYGTHMLELLVVPQAATPGFQEADHHPDAVAAVRPLLDRLANEPLLAIQMGVALLPLVGAGTAAPSPTWDQEGEYASWRSGTMDFLIAPLPADDEVHTISKIIALWGVPDDAEVAAAGMPHAMLAWSGGAESLTTFLTGFVQIGGGDEGTWTLENLEPLRLYIESLRAPEPLVPPNADEVAAGEGVFREAGCVECHGGPRGSGDRVYTFEEIGTDPAMAAWGDPDLDGTPCCGLGDGSGGLTHGIKSPRLVGVGTFGRFLHNGSVDSLEQLLCLEARPDVTEAPWGSEGHTYGCELGEADRRVLAAYLRAK